MPSQKRKSLQIARKPQNQLKSQTPDQPELAQEEPSEDLDFSDKTPSKSSELTPSNILQFQHAFGNQAVRRMLADRHSTPGTGSAIQRSLLSTVIQRSRETKAVLLEKNIVDFDNHRKTEQMDWANDPAFTEAERKIVWAIIDWGISSLGIFKLKDAVDAVKLDSKNLDYLRTYAGGVNGKLSDNPTVQLDIADTLPEALKQGKWLAKLNTAVGQDRVTATIPVTQFDALIADEAVAQKFLAYYAACDPVLQTPTGREVSCFITLVKDEGADILSYKPKLPTIRNLHKFSGPALAKLVDDKGKKDLPLTLILYSAYDHNGAFHRHSGVQSVILNTHTRSVVVEGKDVPDFEALENGGFASIAAESGMGGKITQVMVAGHGSSQLMELAGGKTKVSKDNQGMPKVEPVDPTYLHFRNKSYSDFWTGFFDALLNNMAAKGGINPRILLRACLTNSNDVSIPKVKAMLKTQSGLDVDDKSIDPTTDENQIKIRAGIKKYIKENGSLATVLGDKAKGKADVLGANASINASDTGSVHADGTLDIIAINDPKVASPKIDYVRSGKEPVGALKAVIEVWADDDVKCFKEMQERVDTDPAADADEFIIQLLYKTIIASYKKDIMAANDFVRTASALHDIAAGGAECRVTTAQADVLLQKHKAAFYGALLGSGLVGAQAKLVAFQDWMGLDNSKRANFVALLALFNRTNAVKFLDYTALQPHLTEIYTLATTGGAGSDAEKGGIVLAVTDLVSGASNKASKDYLLTLVPIDKKLPKSITDALKGYSEDNMRTKLGLPVDVPVLAPPPSVDPSVVAPPPTRSKNVDPDKTTQVNKYYVEPMRAQVKNMTKAGLTDKAVLRVEPDDGATEIDTFYFKKNFTIVGEVKDATTQAALGWYMLRADNGTVAYMRTKYF